jgi:hypothetical protein
VRSREDALRSVRRYVWSALGGMPWRVRLELDGRFKRPFVLVSSPPAGPLVPGGPGSVRQALPLLVQAYPVLPPAGPMRTTEARLRAERAGELLIQALTIGAADIADPTVRGYHGRIPLWDYTDDDGEPLPLEGEGAVATRRFYCDYLSVDDGWTVQVQPEAAERQLFVARLNLRVQWFRNARLRSGDVTLQRVEIQT